MKTDYTIPINLSLASKTIIFSFVLAKFDGIINWSYRAIVWGYSILKLSHYYNYIIVISQYFANSVYCYKEGIIIHKETIGSLWV